MYLTKHRSQTKSEIKPDTTYRNTSGHQVRNTTKCKNNLAILRQFFVISIKETATVHFFWNYPQSHGAMLLCIVCNSLQAQKLVYLSKHSVIFLFPCNKTLHVCNLHFRHEIFTTGFPDKLCYSMSYEVILRKTFSKQCTRRFLLALMFVDYGILSL